MHGLTELLGNRIDHFFYCIESGLRKNILPNIRGDLVHECAYTTWAAIILI